MFRGFVWLTLLLGGCTLDLGSLGDKLDEDGDDDDDDDDDDNGGLGGRGDDDDDNIGDDDDDDTTGGNNGGQDAACSLGAEAFCFCSSYYDAACQSGDQDALYDACMNGDDGGVIECMADQVDADYYIDCYTALTECLDDYDTGPGTGPSPP